MRRLTSDQQYELVRILEGVPGMDDPDFRGLVIRQAEQSLSGILNVAGFPRKRDHILAIIESCVAQQDDAAAFLALAGSLHLLAPGTGAADRLRAAFSRIREQVAQVEQAGSDGRFTPAAIRAPSPARLEREQHQVSAGLRKQCERMLSAVDRGRRAYYEVSADSGCGKTLLLQELNAGLQERGHVTLFVTAQGLDSDPGTSEFLIMVRKACDLLVADLMHDVIGAYLPPEGVPARMAEPFGERVVNGLREVHNELQRASPTGFYQDQYASLTAALELARWKLAEVLRSIAGSCRLAVLVDDVHTVITTPVGPWLVEVLREAGAAVVVLGRRPLPVLQEERARETIGRLDPSPVKLGPMNREESDSYVLHELLGADWTVGPATACAGVIYRATRGLPIGVVTCCEILTEGEVPLDATAEQVEAAVLGGDERWDGPNGISAIRRSIDSSVRRLLGRPVESPLEVFEQVSVMRRCTPALLAAVLAEQGLDETQAGQVFGWLESRAYSTYFDDDVKEGWRLHDFLRENVAAQLSRDSLRYQKLHQRVEAYYRELTNLDKELDLKSPHASGTRYEDPVWQRDSQEWLHHAARLSGEHFPKTKNALIRLFLEAFWWWDAEVPSGYCAELLISYRTLVEAVGTADREWVGWLEEFRENYVPGQANQGPGLERERWQRAEAALDQLCASLDITMDELPEDGDLRRIAIIAFCLRGDTAWYSSSCRPARRRSALNWLRAAEAACTEDAELWIRNWAVWMQADLWMAVEPEPERALALLVGLAERIDEQEDNELRVHLIRLYGDIAWYAGDPAAALDRYARAVLHGLVYNVRQETEEQLPNAYSASLYRGVRKHLLDALEEARVQGLTEVVAAATERIRQYFAPFWENLGAEPGPDNPLGLPPGPYMGDLDTGRGPDHPRGLPSGPYKVDPGAEPSGFAVHVRWVIINMSEELAEPPDAPLRPAD